MKVVRTDHQLEGARRSSRPLKPSRRREDGANLSSSFEEERSSGETTPSAHRARPRRASVKAEPGSRPRAATVGGTGGGSSRSAAAASDRQHKAEQVFHDVTVSSGHPTVQDSAHEELWTETFSINDLAARRGAPKCVHLVVQVGLMSGGVLDFSFGVKVFSEKSFRNDKKGYVQRPTPRSSSLFVFRFRAIVASGAAQGMPPQAGPRAGPAAHETTDTAHFVRENPRSCVVRCAPSPLRPGALFWRTRARTRARTGWGTGQDDRVRLARWVASLTILPRDIMHFFDQGTSSYITVPPVHLSLGAHSRSHTNVCRVPLLLPSYVRGRFGQASTASGEFSLLLSEGAWLVITACRSPKGNFLFVSFQSMCLLIVRLSSLTRHVRPTRRTQLQGLCHGQH